MAVAGPLRAEEEVAAERSKVQTPASMPAATSSSGSGGGDVLAALDAEFENNVETNAESEE